MDSRYSVLPKKTMSELQSENAINRSSRSSSPTRHGKFVPLDLETSSSPDKTKDRDAGGRDYGDHHPLIDDGGPAEAGGSGMYGAVFNLTTTVIGAGIMTLPAVMKVLGMVVGFVLIILIGLLSEVSVELLLRFSVIYKASSYGEVVQCALGKTARILSEICIIVNNAGVLVVYLIIMGDVMSGSRSGSVSHIGVLDQWLGHGLWDHRRLLILVMVILFLAPLCALEKIDSLSVTSGASVALAIVFVVVTCSVAFIKLVEGKLGAPKMVPDFSSESTILDLLVVIPIMTNAYVCHFNIQPIYNELEGRSVHKMNQVGRITTVLCIFVYIFTAVSGYLLFGVNTESDILTNFDTDLGIRFSSALNYIVRVGYILHLILVFPVIHFSLRQTVDALVFQKSPPLAESRKRSLGLTAALLTIIYLTSVMIPSIWTAFKFTGATAAVSLGFIFPSLVALKLSRRGEGLSAGEKFLSWLMLVLAVVVGIVGVIGNIYSLSASK